MIESIDYGAWRFWWDVIQTMATIIVGIYVWLATRDRVTNSRIGALEKTSREGDATVMQDLGARISVLEATSRDGDAAVRRELGARVDDVEHRLVGVESTCTLMPTHKDLSGIYERINCVDAKVASVGNAVAEVGGEMRAMRRVMDLINEHLISQGGSK